MRPIIIDLPSAEVARLQAERVRLDVALKTVARTPRSTFEDTLRVSRQMTVIDAAIDAAMAQQAG
jgi:hypothetical protein